MTSMIYAANSGRTKSKKGHANAQYNLGVCYVRGLGITQDYIKAVKWYRKAADQGNALGQHGLGLCYKNGQGVRCDMIQACGWFQLAADQGDEEAKEEAAALVALMSPSEFEIARRLYRELKDTNP